MTKNNTAKMLVDHVLRRVQELEIINEVLVNQSTYAELTSPDSGESLGKIRVFTGTKIIERVVVVSLHAQAMEMDAYMLMAFTRSGSLYPHLAFDTELLPTDSAFHIDLLHKQDFTTDMAYIESVMMPLSAPLDAANNNSKFRFSEATHLMKALLNPWMASYHCLPEHLAESKATIDAYIDHWLSLAERPASEIPVNTSDNDNVARYDINHRYAIFNPKVDVLWDMIAKLIGVESRDLILSLVRGDKLKI